MGVSAAPDRGCREGGIEGERSVNDTLEHCIRVYLDFHEAAREATWELKLDK